MLVVLCVRLVVGRGQCLFVVLCLRLVGRFCGGGLLFFLVAFIVGCSLCVVCGFSFIVVSCLASGVCCFVGCFCVFTCVVFCRHICCSLVDVLFVVC